MDLSQSSWTVVFFDSDPPHGDVHRDMASISHGIIHCHSRGEGFGIMHCW